MAKKHFKLSTSLLIVVVSLLAGVGFGIFNFLYSPEFSESDAAVIPSIDSFDASWYLAGRTINITWRVSAYRTAFSCYGSTPAGYPSLSGWNGILNSGAASMSGGRQLSASINTNYRLKLRCTSSAGSATATVNVTTLVPGSGGCFTADTLVSMADGSRKAIQDINVGESVLSSRGPAMVTQTFFHASNYEPIYLINGHLAATANHPVYANGGWVRADELKVGDRLSGGQTVTSLEKTDRSEPVYNLEVDGSHDYFANGVLVHNKANF